MIHEDIDEDILEEVLGQKKGSKPEGNADHNNHSDSGTVWNNHNNTSHEDWDDHDDAAHTDWDDHDDDAHSDWGNYSDTEHTDWTEHGDAAHDDWDNHSDYAHDDWDNHGDWPWPHSDWDNHTDISHSDWDDHTDIGHLDWSDHDDAAHTDWTEHADNGHEDWDDHDDVAYSDYDDHDDVAPEKKDTKLTCKDSTKEAEVGDTIDLEVKLEEFDFPYYDLNLKSISYTKAGVNIGSCTTDANGECKITYYCSIVETFTATAAFTGDTGYNSSSCTFSVTVSAPSKKDTVICNFDVLDANEDVVTDLYAGVQYWIRAWLCKVEGGGCAGWPSTGCDSDCEISSEELKLYLLGQAASLASGTTNENGYTAFAWIPSEGIGNAAGLDNSIRVEFAGSTAYNSSLTAWKTVTVKLLPYKINVTVKDENGALLEGAYVAALKQISETVWKEVVCTDITVYAGECTTDEWKGYGNLLKTNSSGVVSIGLGTLPGSAMRYGFHAGKLGYLNESNHEDWSEKFETTRRQGDAGDGEGTYNFEFTLTFITEEDKFTVHAEGLKDGDKVRCCAQYLPKCLFPHGCIDKVPDAYPNGTAEFTSADGLKEGDLYGIGVYIPASIVLPFLDTGPSWCGNFKGSRKITIGRYGIAGKACELLGIDAASDECRRFWAEMLDPVYCANCITGVLWGKDIHGAEYHPGTFELAMFPVVLVCSAVPWLPGAKITKFLGRFLKKAAPAAKHGDDVLAVRKYFEDDYLNIYRIQVRGDDAKLTKWAKAVERGDIDGPDGAKKWMRAILGDPSVADAKAVDNFNSWLDELEKQIDSIDPTHPKYAEMVADLRARVLETANACMDDVTDFTKVYDEKYTEFIDVARKGSEDTAVSTFVRAADKTCSPGGWHCKFSFLNALGDVTVGAEKVNLWDITAVLHKNGLLDDSKYVYKNIIKAFAHADESQIRALRLALEAENYDEVIRLLNDLPRVDMEGRLIARFFNIQRVKAIYKWLDRNDEILNSSKFLGEEMDEIAGVARKDILWYRFAKTADTRENLIINMLRNASRGPEVVTPAGRSAFTALSFNNGSGMFGALRGLSDDEYLTLLTKLGSETEEGKLLGRLKALQTGIDNETITIPAGTDIDTWVRVNIRETISGISPAEYGGPWPELANKLIGEFPSMTPDRVVAECSMLTDDFKKAEGGVQWRRVRTAGVSKLTSEGYTTREAELLVEGKIETYIKELTKKPFAWAIDHPLKAFAAGLGAVGAAYAYASFGFWIVWYYEELPQMTSMPMYMAVKNEDWLTASQIWVAHRATIGDLESKAKMVKFVWPLWADWIDTCIDAHKAANAAYLYMIDPTAPQPKLPEGMKGHVMDVIDSDTIWSGMPDSKLEEMVEYIKEHNPLPLEPKEDAFIPPTLTIRFAGANGPDKGDVSGYWIHRISTIGGEPEIVETTGDCYTNASTWTYTALSRKDVFILSDQSNQWETFRKGRVCRFIGVIRYGTPYKYASEELIRSGWGKVYFYAANKHVSISKYLTIEATASDAKLGLWSPACTPCPATEVWFTYTTPVRVDEEATFKGFVLGCEPTEITDWTWTGFPDDVVRTGREITYTFDAEWSGKIYLEICAGALRDFRTITVREAHPNRKSPCAPCGNVNGDTDDYVNDLDATLVQRYIERGWDDVKSDVVEGIDEAEFKARADVDGDKEVTQDDVDKIYEFYVGDRNSFPACPGKCPAPHADFSFNPHSPVVGQEVVFACKSSGGDKPGGGTYNIVKRKWDFGDGTTNEDNNGLVYHTYTKADTYDVYLTVTNDCDSGESDRDHGTITVKEKPVPPPDTGTLTIRTYATRDFDTADPLGVETFYIDDAIVPGTYSCTKTGLLISENPHTVKIDFKAAPHTCYVDTLDECFDTCAFSINVVKDVTTVVKVCPARSVIFSSNYPSTISAKPTGAADTEYEAVGGIHSMPLGAYTVKFVKPGYSTVVGYITVESGGVSCEVIEIPPDGTCYPPQLPQPAEPIVTPGIYISGGGFVVKGLLKALPSKTVTFTSVPAGATVTVLD